jgi:virulence factor Mce-like protein
MNRRPAPTIMANPVLVGAATLLVVLVGVFLAYNANSGLPFVPTYQVDAIVPDAAELVRGNDVRIGGKRVGTIDAIEARRTADGHVVSRLSMKLEKPVEPLPADTKVTVRPRSTLGLKYVELQPGSSKRGIPAGGTIPVQNAGKIVELDEVLNAFDAQARAGLQGVVEPLATGLAGRGGDLNRAVAALRPAVRLLRPVARNFRSARTDLPGFIAGIDAAAAAAEPVATTLARLLGDAGITFSAINAQRSRFQAFLEAAPATIRVTTDALTVARPVLADSAALAEALVPAAGLLPATTRRLAGAVETGTPVLRRGTRLGPDLEGVLQEVERLAKDPATSGAVVKLTSVVGSLEPTQRFLNPFQTVCNYLGLWTRNASSVISEGDANGTWFRFVPVMQPSEILQSAAPAPELHVTPYGKFHGECEVGNERYRGGQVIGNTPEQEPNRTQDTAPPAGIPKGPGQ